MITISNTTLCPGEACELQIQKWKGPANSQVCRFFELEVQDERTAGSRRHDVLKTMQGSPPSAQAGPYLDSPHHGPCGAMSTLEELQKYFHWPGIEQDVETALTDCVGCLHKRTSN